MNKEKTSNNYFFRFGQENKIFNNNYELVDSKDVEKGFQNKKTKEPVSEFWLAIYYAKFTAKDYYREDFRQSARTKDKINIYLTENEMRQIDLFLKAPQGSLFWLYLDENIVCLEADTDGHYHNIKQKIKNLDLEKDNLTTPKARRFWLKKVIPRIEAPELFVTLDSSGFQGTILKLDELPAKKENIEIGSAILNNDRIHLRSIREAIRYLAPVQLETLWFKLFNDNDYHASAFRGGSKFLVDLVVEKANRHTLERFPDKKLQFQIKRTYGFSYKKATRDYFSRGIYFVTIDDRVEESFKKYNQELFIGPTKFSEIFSETEGVKCIEWIKAILGAKYFIHDY